jgi:hypothetical protein
METTKREQTIEFRLPRLHFGELYWMVKSPDEPSFITIAGDVSILRMALHRAGYDLGLTEFFQIEKAEALAYCQLKQMTPFKHLYDREVQGFLHMEFDDGSIVVEKLWYGHEGSRRVQELRERACRVFWFPMTRYGEYSDFCREKKEDEDGAHE